MNNIKRRALQLITAALIVVNFCACGSTYTVKALDYELESEAHSGSVADTTPAVVETDPAEPEIEPSPEVTPEQPENTPTPSAPPEPSATTEPSSTPEPAETQEPSEAPAPSTSPEPTPEATPEPSAEPTQAYKYLLTVLVDDGTPMPNVHVTLYAGDSVLYTKLTDDKGCVSWSLPGAAAYHAKAVLDGYEVIENTSTVEALEGDASVRIVMCRTQTEQEAEDAPATDFVEYTEDSYQAYTVRSNLISSTLAPVMSEIEAQFAAQVTELTKDFNNVRFMGRIAESVSPNGMSIVDFNQTDSPQTDFWGDILAVYIAAKTDIDTSSPLELLRSQNSDFDGLDEVFNNMVKLSVASTDDYVSVLVDVKSWQEAAQLYGLDNARSSFLQTLMQPEYQQVLSGLMGRTSVTGADVSADEIKASLGTGVSEERRKVIETACSLVGQVGYFWGGKYNELGACEAWGTPTTVTAEGSGSTGMSRPYGLDCSGFVSWALINAFGDPSLIDSIGNGTSNQWACSETVMWEEGQPGDLVFINTPSGGSDNHVGIIAFVIGDGNYIVIHCSGGGVEISDARSVGFNYVRRPGVYE